jgi:hypothetical protein
MPIVVANKVQLLLLSDKISEPKQGSLHSPRHAQQGSVYVITSTINTQTRIIMNIFST